jgi:molybdopterin-guanine dinucleotide biosynthesis protein
MEQNQEAVSTTSEDSPNVENVLRRIVLDEGFSNQVFEKIVVIRQSDAHYMARMYPTTGEDFEAFHIFF